MKRRLLVLIACLGMLPFGVFAKTPSALFYMMETQKSINSFEAHIDKIDVLVPTWFGVDENGLVSGAPNAYVLAMAKAHRLPVMPIISAGGDRKKFHDLMASETAKKAMIEGMITQARLYGFVGFQFDFDALGVLRVRRGQVRDQRVFTWALDANASPTILLSCTMTAPSRPIRNSRTPTSISPWPTNRSARPARRAPSGKATSRSSRRARGPR